MKRIVTALVVLLCFVAALSQPPAKAAGSVYFTAIDNTLLPLSDETMPASINGLLYIPYTFFPPRSSAFITPQASTRSCSVPSPILKYLTFDVLRSTVLTRMEISLISPPRK